MASACDATALLQVGAARGLATTPDVFEIGKHSVQDMLGKVNETASAIVGRVYGFISNAEENSSEYLAAETFTINTTDDLQAFLLAAGIYSMGILGLFIVFSILRAKYPIVYANNLQDDSSPHRRLPLPSNGPFDWLKATLAVSTTEAAQAIGLDSAMMLEFSNLAMNIMLQVGVPLLLVIAPLNFLIGGHASGEDYLSMFSINNVRNGHWLLWIHALSVHVVVELVCRQVYDAQGRFLKLRYAWLASMDTTQAKTVLVQGIPSDCSSDDGLTKFFEKAMPGSEVQGAYCVRDTQQLMQHIERYKAIQQARRIGEEPSMEGIILEPVRLASLPQRLSSKAESPRECDRQLEELQIKIDTERARLTASDLACYGNGFVTFSKARCSEVALQLQFSSSREEWILSTPPPPQEVEWTNLMWDRHEILKKNLFGHMLVAALFLAYLPLVFTITRLAEMINMGPAQPLWEGLAPSMGLQVMVSLLPSLLLLIARPFFLPVSEAQAQAFLGQSYFWFQLVFVVLSAPVGRSVVPILKMLTRDMFAVLKLLARTLPSATHFYMNFLVLKWFSNSLNLIRPATLAKFLFFSRFMSEEEAKAAVEPEDQAFHGLGARSARWSTVLTIGIVFGTISPLMCLLTWIDFAICRVCFGYLMCFAETVKPDQGGVVWVDQLRHIFVALGVYWALMVGVLLEKGRSAGPAWLASIAVARLLWYSLRFGAAFVWQRAPITDVKAAEDLKAPCKPSCDVYVQPELQ